MYLFICFLLSFFLGGARMRAPLFSTKDDLRTVFFLSDVHECRIGAPLGASAAAQDALSQRKAWA